MERRDSTRVYCKPGTLGKKGTIGRRFTLAGSFDSTIWPKAVKQPCNSSVEIIPSLSCKCKNHAHFNLMMVNQDGYWFTNILPQCTPYCTVISVKMIKNYTDAIEVVEGGTEFVHLFGRKTLGISHHNLKSYFSSFVRSVCGGRFACPFVWTKADDECTWFSISLIVRAMVVLKCSIPTWICSIV